MNIELTDHHSNASNRMDSLFTTEAARWEAVCRRDLAADGHFLFAVNTTGVYCRPSCASRPAREKGLGWYLLTEPQDCCDQDIPRSLRPLPPSNGDFSQFPSAGGV